MRFKIRFWLPVVVGVAISAIVLHRAVNKPTQTLSRPASGHSLADSSADEIAEPFEYNIPQDLIERKPLHETPYKIYQSRHGLAVALTVSPLTAIRPRLIPGRGSALSTRDLMIDLAELDMKRNALRASYIGSVVPLQNRKWPDMVVYQQDYRDVLELDGVQVEEAVKCFGVERAQLVRIFCVRSDYKSQLARLFSLVVETQLIDSIRPTATRETL